MIEHLEIKGPSPKALGDAACTRAGDPVDVGLDPAEFALDEEKGLPIVHPAESVRADADQPFLYLLYLFGEFVQAHGQGRRHPAVVEEGDVGIYVAGAGDAPGVSVHQAEQAVEIRPEGVSGKPL
jgi:hypothetical protein